MVARRKYFEWYLAVIDDVMGRMVGMGQELRVWSGNVGKQVSHHSGPLPWLQQCKIIAKCSAKARGGYELGSLGLHYKVVPWSATLAVSLDQMALTAVQLSQFGAPRSWGDWHAMVCRCPTPC